MVTGSSADLGGMNKVEIMIRKLSILTALIFMAIGMQAQSTASSSKELKCDKPCVPTKECAAKYGMTLEECKKKCQKSEASASLEGETKVASYEVKKSEALVDKTTSSKVCSKKKKCCKSKKEATKEGA